MNSDSTANNDMSGTAVIEIEGLRKFYKGKHRGVDGVDLTVEEGEIFGFLGPNGGDPDSAGFDPGG